MSRAACAPENHPPVDLVSIDEHTRPDVVEQARAVCLACPVLSRCAPRMKRMDVAGMAGGMTEAERKAWQERHGIAVDVVDLVSVTPARQLTAAMLDGLPESRNGEIPPEVRALVLRMTDAGMSDEEITELIGPNRVTDTTVKYLRRTYQKGWARVGDIA